MVLDLCSRKRPFT